MMRRILWATPVLLLSPLWALDVTVYNENLGLVRESKTFDIKRGENTIRLSDISAMIDPTSLYLKSLTAPTGLTVLEQNFQYDLLYIEKLLQKYIGKEVEWERPAEMGKNREILRGTLLATGPILQVGKKLYVNPEGRAILPELPEGFVTRPTLVWKVHSKSEGKQDCEIGYLTGGLTWQSDYILKVSPKDDRMDLTAWVTLTNTSGAVYPNARLKLVAGDVHRAPEPMAPRHMMMKAAAMDRMEEEAFVEKSFFEYHLYTLQRPTTLMNNETKQIEMARASDIPVKKLFIYNGAANAGQMTFNTYTQTDPSFGISSEKKVSVFFEFKNSKDNNLGLALPRGKVRVYKQDTDGALEFIGEDALDHTPKDELVRVKLGEAFDVVGERTRTNFLTEKRSMTETFEIKVRNHKDEPIQVRVVEPLYRWNQWKVLESSQKFIKRDAQTIEFDVPVAKDGSATVRYTVKYTW